MTRPTGGGLSGLALTILSAALGGSALGLAGVPAGWLSGAMLGVAALSATGKGALLPDPLRRLAILTTGVGMGSGLTPGTIHTLSRYPLSLALMAVALVVMTSASFLVLARSPGFDRRTAFYSGIPGALSFVIVVATEAGADMPRLAVIQIFRIFVLMAIVPLLARAGFAPPVFVFAIDPLAVTLALIAVAAAVGWALERRGVATGPLYAAICVSALAHGLGWAPGRLAPNTQIAAQILIGAWVGTRFIGFDWSLLRHMLIPAFTSFLAAFAAAAIFALGASYMVGVPFAEALIAFAPGGLEAMTMMAFALGLDPLFVGAHHLARFFVISLALPLTRRWIDAVPQNSP